ncbi:hypothetical protein GQ607_013221 [Colletotrichum asianum]|uniref:Uncharacterized protein n=1 Tax=Colletotrichum asianum TaxID=702518 RepID=A0A8H3W1R5_9PEZI|nr:hypothetical protein GQ607_013221 [Colletotrichum asianum]
MIRRFGPQLRLGGSGLIPLPLGLLLIPTPAILPSHSNLPDTNWLAAASPRLGKSFPPATPQRRSPHLSLARYSAGEKLPRVAAGHPGSMSYNGTYSW